MRKIVLVGIIGQWVGLVCSIAGIVLLSLVVVNPASIFISVGSLTWGIGTKIKYYGGLKTIEKERGRKVSIDELLNEHNIIPFKKEN